MILIKKFYMKIIKWFLIKVLKFFNILNVKNTLTVKRGFYRFKYLITCLLVENLRSF